ncbi:MAG TPA: helix-turn-helix transcriptional regulator [Tepidisphaeraceae bacterium]|jgi:transcriptional regulator with XRE-family HTH domain
MIRDRGQMSTTLSAQVIDFLKQKYTQAQIARILHVSEPFISLVKNRERSLTIDHLELLADALSMPLGVMLLVMTEPKSPSKETPEEKARFAHLIELCDKLREAILHAPAISKRKMSA